MIFPEKAVGDLEVGEFEDVNRDIPSTTSTNISMNKNGSRKGIGRKPSIPEIINEVAEFIKQHGFAAQSKRRTAILHQVFQLKIKEHQTFPLLKECIRLYGGGSYSISFERIIGVS